MVKRASDGLDAVRELDRCRSVEIQRGCSVASPSLMRLRADLALRNFEVRFAAELSEAHKKFARYYVNSGYDAQVAATAAEVPHKNATAAERKAFIDATLTHTYVQEYLRLYSEADMHFRLRSVEEAMHELENIAFSRPSDYMEELPNGMYRVKLDLADKDKMAAISKIKTVAVPVFTNEGEPDGTVAGIQVEFHDKLGALKEVIKFHETRNLIATNPYLISDSEMLPRAASTAVARETTFKVVVTPVPTGFFIPAPPAPHETAEAKPD